MLMEPNNKSTRTVQAVDTLFAILEFIKENEGAGVTELADELDMAKSSIHRYLVSLIENGYVVKENGQYYLGLRFLNLSTVARDRKAVNRITRPHVQELAEITGERAQFIVEEYGRGIYVHLETGDRAVETDTRTGKIVNLTTTAAGKSMLAYYPHEKVKEIVDQHGFNRRTENTIRSIEKLTENLETIHERGYAINKEEHVKGLWGVAVPVKTADAVLGSLSVAGPTHRMKPQISNEQVPNQLLGFANEIELNIEYN